MLLQMFRPTCKWVKLFTYVDTLGSEIVLLISRNGNGVIEWSTGKGQEKTRMGGGKKVLC